MQEATSLLYYERFPAPGGRGLRPLLCRRSSSCVRWQRRGPICTWLRTCALNFGSMPPTVRGREVRIFSFSFFSIFSGFSAFRFSVHLKSNRKLQQNRGPEQKDDKLGVETLLQGSTGTLHLDGRWMLAAQHLIAWSIFIEPTRRKHLPSLPLLLHRLSDVEHNLTMDKS